MEPEHSNKAVSTADSAAIGRLKVMVGKRRKGKMGKKCPTCGMSMDKCNCK